VEILKTSASISPWAKPISRRLDGARQIAVD
jgi:hypothetical protein